MKKFFIILVLLVIFSICAIFGFSGARSTLKAISDSPTAISSTVVPGTPSAQHNLLVVRVDDLNSPSPVLLSSWIYFLTYSDPPTMVMKILYPGPQSDTLANSFSIDKNRHISSRFLKEIRKLNFPWDGYILLDNTGFEMINEWILGQPAEVVPYENGGNIDGFALYVYESRQLTSLCQNLQGINQRGTTLHWREITPAHFSSDLSFENLVLFWDYLTQSSAPPYCEIIPWG